MRVFEVSLCSICRNYYKDSQCDKKVKVNS